MLLQNHESAIDITIPPRRLFLKPPDRIAIKEHLAETGFRMDGGHRDQFAAFPVGLIKFSDIHITHTVAVGEKETIVILLEILCRFPHPVAGHGILARTGESDFPIGFIGFAVKRDIRRMPQFDRGIGSAQMVVDKIIDKSFAFVTQTENETAHTECGITFHNVPDDGLFTDGDHRFGEQLRNIAQTGPFAAAEDHQGNITDIFH